MDKSLLRKAAIQSLALMLFVITFSYALHQYRTITIKAGGKASEQTSVYDESSGLQKVTGLSNIKSEVSDAELATLKKLVPGANQKILQKLGDSFLIIQKPRGSSLLLKLKDLYINKSIQLTIAGMATDDLTTDMITRVSGYKVFSGDPKYTEKISNKVNGKKKIKEKVVTRDYGDDLCHRINISSSEDANTKQYTAKMLIELDRVYAYITYEDDQHYFIDLRKPSQVYNKILVIDAGHGGKDCGALSKDDKYYEKNLNLKIVLELKKLLDKENIKVYYTRTSDDTVYLRPREELANEVDCDYFISIHCNASKVSIPNGTEVLYYNKEFKGVNALKLAKLFSKQLDNSIDLTNKGAVRRNPKDIYIMNKAKVPMVLIEVGYVTNNKDINYLNRPENRLDVAKGIYNGIMKAYKELPVNKK